MLEPRCFMTEYEIDNTRGARALFVMRAGGRLFAVYGEEVEATAEGLTATPLPHAPTAVCGVVSLRGRVRTVLDPLRVIAAHESSGAAGATDATDATATDRDAPRLFIALRGDEQLALVCDGAEGLIEVARANLTPPPDAQSPTLGTFAHRGLNVTLLDPARLFDAAMQGMDRRRKRS
ncbi:MAG: CheW-like domain [Acidobacteriota bacterium]|nr:CheW-like domain [Acidobacteriota bacterium]